MCTVASAPVAFRVRVWHLMSRGRGPRGGDRCRRSFVLPLLLLHPEYTWMNWMLERLLELPREFLP
jgi:hypothetical protein